MYYFSSSSASATNHELTQSLGDRHELTQINYFVILSLKCDFSFNCIILAPLTFRILRLWYSFILRAPLYLHELTQFNYFVILSWRTWFFSLSQIQRQSFICILFTNNDYNNFDNLDFISFKKFYIISTDNYYKISKNRMRKQFTFSRCIWLACFKKVGFNYKVIELRELVFINRISYMISRITILRLILE